METKSVLILGAGNSQVDAINYCKDLGIKVIGCSYTVKDSGIPLLDAFEQVDIKDVAGIREIAIKYNVDAIYSVGSDLAIPPAMKVSEELKLPHFISYDTATICHSKHLFRQYLGPDFDGNIEYIVCESIDEARSFNSFPSMMKPVDSQGQRGCYRVDSMEDIEKHFADSIAYSVEGKVIIESYIDGPEVSVNAYFQNGEMIFALASDRIVYDEFPGGVIKEHRVPSQVLSEEANGEVLDLVERIANKVGITDGPCYCQMKLDKNCKPYVLEVAPRLDGCHMWNLIKHYCGVDLLKASFEHLFNGETKLGEMKPDPSATYKLIFMCKEPGAIFDRSEYDVSGSEYVRWYYDTGDKVYKVNGHFEKCGYVIKKTV